MGGDLETSHLVIHLANIGRNIQINNSKPIHSCIKYDNNGESLFFCTFVSPKQMK
jgi:hypothetical protein